MVPLLAAAVLALLPQPGGLPGDVSYVTPQGDAAPNEAGASGFQAYQLPDRLLSLPPLVVLEDSPPVPGPIGMLQRAVRPLHLGLETWQGTLCVQGAWTLRASDDNEQRLGVPRVPLWQLQISPAVLDDGARLGPGIGASTRF